MLQQSGRWWWSGGKGQGWPGRQGWPFCCLLQGVLPHSWACPQAATMGTPDLIASASPHLPNLLRRPRPGLITELSAERRLAPIVSRGRESTGKELCGWDNGGWGGGGASRGLPDMFILGSVKTVTLGGGESDRSIEGPHREAGRKRGKSGI